MELENKNGEYWWQNIWILYFVFRELIMQRKNLLGMEISFWAAFRYTTPSGPLESFRNRIFEAWVSSLWVTPKADLSHFPPNRGNSQPLSLFPFLTLKYCFLPNKIIACHWIWPTTAKFISTPSPISIKSHSAFPSQKLPGVLRGTAPQARLPVGVEMCQSFM